VFHCQKLLLSALVISMCTLVGGCGGNRDAAATANIPGGAADAKEPAPPKPVSDDYPVVRIETSLGSITLRLDRKKAPRTVDNFLDYIRAGHYKETIIHQVYAGHGFLAGGFDLNGVQRPTRTPIFNEAQNGLKNRRGTISMVRVPNSVHSATSQFFINVADNANLDFRDTTPEGFGYCVFGEVTEGLREVVDRIVEVTVHDTAAFDRTPVEPIFVKSIQRIQ
jgi:cyclophilin family peptidyl-prolyl cis-trans isomerase